MENAINFRELRRRERERMRAARRHRSGDVVPVGVDASAKATVRREPSPRSASPPSPAQSSNSHARASKSNDYPLTPFGTLLPHDTLSDAAHRVGASRQMNAVFYARHFLAPAQATEITAWLRAIPDHAHCGVGRAPSAGRTEREESLAHNGKWTRLKHARRKVAMFDGTICGLPPILQRISNTLVAVGAFPSSHPPNHVLINEYQPGEGIMPHTDGPAYESRTATISLGGSDVIFRLWPRPRHDAAAPPAPLRPAADRPALEVLLHGRGSLVLFADDAYLHHCHEIREGVREETTGPGGVCGNDVRGGTVVRRGRRVSLTLRCKKTACGETVPPSARKS